MAVNSYQPSNQQPLRRLSFGLGAMMGLYAVSLIVGEASETSNVVGGIGLTLSVASILGAGLVLSWFVVVKWRRQPAEVLARALPRRPEL